MTYMKKNKLKIYYEIHGKGPRLVFITGTASDLRQKYNIFNSPLVQNFEILSMDQRGIGQSNSPDIKPTMETYSKDIKNLMDSVGWDCAYIMGESFGGMVAQELAIDYPQYVKKLVLTVTSTGGKGGSSFPYHEHPLGDMSSEERAKFFVASGDLRAANDKWVKENSDIYLQQYDNYLEVFNLNKNNPNKKIFSERQIYARKFHDTYDRIKKIKIPTYICAGKYDRTAPIENQLALLHQIQNSRLTFFNGSHMILWQDPLAFTSIRDFLLENN